MDLTPLGWCALCRRPEWSHDRRHRIVLLTEGWLTFDEAVGVLEDVGADDYTESTRGSQSPASYAETDARLQIAIASLRRLTDVP